MLDKSGLVRLFSADALFTKINNLVNDRGHVGAEVSARVYWALKGGVRRGTRTLIRGPVMRSTNELLKRDAG